MRKTIFATFAAAAIGGLAAASAAAGDITAVSGGGAYTKSQIEAYHKPWTTETGNGINSADHNGGLAEVIAQAETDDVSEDAVDQKQVERTSLKCKNVSVSMKLDSSGELVNSKPDESRPPANSHQAECEAATQLLIKSLIGGFFGGKKKSADGTTDDTQ